MAITDSIARLASTIITSIHTRLELISVELEEELARFSTYLLWSLVALACAGIAVLLLILLVVAVFWDTHRFLVLGLLIGLFASTAIGLAYWLRSAIRQKPRLLAHSLAELRRDSDSLSGNASTSENHAAEK